MGEALSDGNAQHPVVPFQRLNPVDEAAGRFARGVNRHHHAAVGQRGHRVGPALRLGFAQSDEFARPLHHIGVRIFLHRYQDVGVVHHRRCQVHVRVELGTHDHLGPHHGAHPRQHVAFAIVVAVGDHRAVQAEQHHVHRKGAAQVGQQLLAQPFIGFPGDGAAGLGAGDHALDQGPALARGHFARRAQRPREECQLFRVLPRREIAPVLEGRQAGGHGSEGIGLGRQGAAENAHRHPGAYRSSIQTVGRPRHILSSPLRSLRAAKAGEYWPRLM